MNYTRYSVEPIKESAIFRIKNGETAVSFKVEGSTVAALVEAFTWLTPERRLKVLTRLQSTQDAFLKSEADIGAKP